MKMTFTFNLTAGINGLKVEGIKSESKSMHHDNPKSYTYGCDHGTAVDIDSITGSADVKVNMDLSFDMTPEELKNSYEYIEKLATRFKCGAEIATNAVKQAADAINKEAATTATETTEEKADLSPRKSNKNQWDEYPMKKVIDEAFASYRTSPMSDEELFTTIDKTRAAINAIESAGKEDELFGTIADLKGNLYSAIERIGKMHK